MAYINFKEELFVGRKQLKKRKENNQKITKDIVKHKDKLKNYKACEKFSYKLFNESIFGKDGILDEDKFAMVDNKDILFSNFTNCLFKNIKFKECRFIGCVFENCDFEGGGVTFENCTFLKEDTENKPSLNKYDNLSCEFSNCNLYSKFLNCILGFIIFDSCNIKDTNFEQCEMTNAIIVDSKLDMIIISDCDLCGAKIMSTYIENLEFRDKFQTKLDEKTFIDKIEFRTKTREEYEGIYMVYQTIANKFKENSLDNNFGEYYYLCKNVQRKVLKPIPKLYSTIYWLTCGYGERPGYAVIFSLISMLVFAILYLIVGIEVGDKTIIYNLSTIRNLNMSKFISDFNQAITLSIDIFSGVGQLDAIPRPQSYYLVNLEVLIGVLMIGVGVGTLTRKIIR